MSYLLAIVYSKMADLPMRKPLQMSSSAKEIYPLKIYHGTKSSERRELPFWFQGFLPMWGPLVYWNWTYYCWLQSMWPFAFSPWRQLLLRHLSPVSPLCCQAKHAEATTPLGEVDLRSLFLWTNSEGDFFRDVDFSKNRLANAKTSLNIFWSDLLFF